MTVLLSSCDTTELAECRWMFWVEAQTGMLLGGYFNILVTKWSVGVSL